MSIDFSKRYWLFEWNDYYPLGGLDNVTDSTNDPIKAYHWTEDKNDFDQRKTWDNRSYCFLPDKDVEAETEKRFDLLEEKIEAVMDAFNAVSGAQLNGSIDSKESLLDKKLADLTLKVDMMANAVYNKETVILPEKAILCTLQKPTATYTLEMLQVAYRKGELSGTLEEEMQRLEAKEVDLPLSEVVLDGVKKGWQLPDKRYVFLNHSRLDEYHIPQPYGYTDYECCRGMDCSTFTCRSENPEFHLKGYRWGDKEYKIPPKSP